MPTPAQRKGKRVEYLVRDALREIGLCERIPCSGNARAFKGDLVLRLGDEEFKVEVKARKKLSLINWFKNADLLVVKVNHKPPIVLLPLDIFKKLIKKCSTQLYKKSGTL